MTHNTSINYFSSGLMIHAKQYPLGSFDFYGVKVGIHSLIATYTYLQLFTAMFLPIQFYR